jgi:hypothetical protein
MVSIVAKELKTGRSIYEILQILEISLPDKIPINDILKNNDYKVIKEPIHNLFLCK